MTLLLLGGIQIICTGLIAEMLVYVTHRDGSSYAVSEILEPRA